MNKKQADELTNDVLIADALLRVKTLENILIDKGILTREEFQAEIMMVTQVIAKSILQKANVPGDLDEIVKNLQGNVVNKDTKN